MNPISFFERIPFVEKLVWFIGMSFAGWILAKLIILIWERIISPLASKTDSSLDDHLAKNLHKPVTRLLVLGAIYLSALLTMANAKEVASLVEAAEQVLYVIMVLLIASIFNAIFKSFSDWYMQDIASKTESTLDDTLFPILRKAGAIIIYFVAATVILGQFKVNLTGFLATAGVASLAIAFAAQETLSNVIAGISILLDRSFHVGERIELKDGLVGDVLEIGLRSTKILSLDQRLIIVPNKEIAGSRLINWNQPDPGCKIKLKIGVGMNEDLERVKRVILEECAKEPGLSKNSPAGVFCTGFGPYYMEMLIVAGVDNCRDGFGVVDKLAVSLQKAFIREQINLPYPQQNIQIVQNGKY